MSIQVACRCGQRFKAEPHLYGKRVQCPACGNALDIPAPKAHTPSSAPIPITCRCGRQFRAQPHLSGQTVPCPVCGIGITISASSANGLDHSSTSEDWGLDLACAAPPVPSRPQRTLQARPRPAPRRRTPINPRPFIIAGITIAGIVVVGFVVLSIWNAVSDAIARSQEINWQEHDEGTFTILFPSRPRPERIPGGPPMWKATCGKLTASAGATRIPPSKRKEAGWEEEFWNLIRTANVDGRQLVSEQEIEFHGCTGKDFVFDMSIRGTPAKIHTRFLIDGGFLYELNWIVPADNLRPDEMAKFFDSFAIKGVNDRPSGSEGVLSAESPSGPPVSRADSAAQTASSEPATSRLPSRETLPSSQRPMGERDTAFSWGDLLTTI